MPTYNPRTGENEPDPVNVVEAAPIGTAGVDPPEAATVLERLGEIGRTLQEELALLAQIAEQQAPAPSSFFANDTTLLHRS